MEPAELDDPRDTDDDPDLAYLDALEQEAGGGRAFVRMKPHPRELPKRDPSQVAEATASAESGFQTTYKPSRHEEGWLLSSLGAFYEQDLITDILYLVKGGKEANVYCCVAGPGVPGGEELLAAKVYRPRQFRNLRNDHLYREGRPVLTAEGRPVKNSDQRTMRALGKKTEFGAQVQHTSWLMYEYTTLERLHAHGAPVPRPIAAGENAVLMSYVGDRQGAAPTLIEVTLAPDEARGLYRQVVRGIEAMAAQGVIHGDLSAYNILCREGRATLIDFPQVVDAATNEHARDILRRDITRVCDYFARLGVPCDAPSLERDVWRRFFASRAIDTGVAVPV